MRRCGSVGLTWIALSGAALVLAAGCAEDDGGGVPLDVTGHWKFTGGPDPVFGCLEQTGGDVIGFIADMPGAGTVSGDTLSLILGDQGSGDYFDVTMTSTGPDTLTGTSEIYEGGVLTGTGSGTMERFTPSGQLQLDGTLAAEPVSIDTSDLACAMVRDEGSEVWADVYYMTADGFTLIMFRPDSSTLGTGRFTSPGEVVVEFEVTTQTSSDWDYHAPGTLEITKFDAGGFAGSFSGTLFEGGTMEGSFDVPWDIVTGTPF